MLQNIMFVISYDGTNYCGWQKQKNGITIQEVIERACLKIFKKKIEVLGSSRTDSGVHAEYQVVTIQVETNITIDKIPIVFNQMLPLDIVVRDARYVPIKFHPIKDVKYKIYKYNILYSDTRVPKLKNYTCFYYKQLDLEAMNYAVKQFIGTYDFKAFCSSKTVTKTTVRTIFDMKIKNENNIISIYVKGNGFLHNMVRIIVGTLIKVGEKKIDKDEIKNIIYSKDRKLAGPTAPPQGLTLEYVEYGEIR
ncbi:MAG: tRNA pseudouridine(38-40) synthase TruA [Clostridiales bacterium GWE2_32_10]|nr:MAG: tRNA pseudouridine(38-40) synthase TruA [Clostridiales bacterium GWE2_32_10]HBY21428.1 tRNA pseudouridine(38-40) synthase TruA [Clostridiales bacterium]